MENKEETKTNARKGLKPIIIIIIVILILAILGLLIWKLLPKTNGENISSDIPQELIDKSTASGNSADTNNVIITNEGIKVNISNKMFEEKKAGKFTIKDMSVSSQNGRSTITFNVINNSKDTITGKDYVVKFLTNKGKEIESLTGTIENIEPGVEQIIYLNSDIDLSNSYDYSFKIK